MSDIVKTSERFLDLMELNRKYRQQLFDQTDIGVLAGVCVEPPNINTGDLEAACAALLAANSDLLERIDKEAITTFNHLHPEPQVYFP